MIVKLLLWLVSGIKILWCWLFHWKDSREQIKCASDYYSNHYHTIVKCNQCGRLRIRMEPSRFINFPYECRTMTMKAYLKDKKALYDEELKKLLEEGISKL